MKLNKTPNPLNREARNKENENWDKIERNFKNVVEEVSDRAFDKVIDGSKIDWSQMVDDIGELPTDAGEGETRGVKSDNKIYRFNGADWVPIAEINLNPIAEVDQRLTTQLAQIAVNVLKYGAMGDGVTNDTQAFNNAIAHVHALGGGNVYVPTPDDYYKILGSINMMDNVYLVGSPQKPRLYNDTTSENIVNIIGVTNVEIHGLTIQNGVSTTGRATQGKNGIWVENSNNIAIFDNVITETEGQYGLRTETTNGIKVYNNTFYKNTYASCMFMAETENIEVYGNTFDTITSTDYPYTYLLATGNDNIDEGYQFFIKNMWVYNNKFLNNPLWEGIDCHGGENIWIYNNYIENVKQGIMCQVAPGGYVLNPIHKNIHIYNNTIKQGNGEDGLNGIAVGGSVHVAKSEYIRAKNINVVGNRIKGFGDSSGSIGSIVLRNSEDVTISNNILDDVNTLGINIYMDNQHVTVNGNIVKNPINSTSIGIATRGVGNSFIDIKENHIYSDSNKTLFEHGIYFHRPSLVNVENNTIKALNDYGNTTRSLLNKNFATNFNHTYGYRKFKGFTPNDIVKFVCDMEDNLIRGVEAGFPDVISVNGFGGNNHLTLASGSNLYHLLEGMEIVINGGGVDGGDLLTYVVKRDNINMTIAHPLSTSVTGATVESTPASWIDITV